MKKKMKKIISMLLVCCVMLTLLTGCGGKQGEKDNQGDSDEQVSITFAGWGELAEKAVFTDLIAEFMEQNPNIKVNYQHYPGSKDAYIVKMVSSIAANKLPDAFYLPTQDFVEWADSGRLMDLTDYLEKSDVYEEGLIWEQAMKLYRYNSETKNLGEDGALYGLPKDLSVRTIVYNVDLFKAAGVSLPDPEIPMTQSEYLELAKKLTTGSGAEKVYGTGNYVLDMAVWANGGSYLSDDKKTVTVDTAEFAEALQWTADLSLVHGVAPTASETATTSEFQRFCNGTLAMMFMGPWNIATLWESVDFEFDIAPIPVNDKTGKAVTWLDSAALCVSATTKEAEAAYKLVEFISMNEDSQRINYESGQAIPNIVDMAETEFVELESMPSNRQLYIHYLKTPEERRMKDFYYTMSSDWYDYFETQVTVVYRGEKTATEFLREVQPTLQDMLEAGQ